MINGKYCIYKYIYQNKIVYIGKSNVLDDRIRQHNSEIKFFGLDEIYYFICDNKNSMDINEAFYINQYNPILNEVKPKINEKFLNLVIYNPKWEKYEKNYASPLPLVINWHENLKGKVDNSPVGYIGDYILENIDFYSYGGIDFIPLDKFHEYQLKIRDMFDDAVGVQVHKIMQYLCYKENVHNIQYLGNNKYHVERT